MEFIRLHKKIKRLENRVKELEDQNNEYRESSMKLIKQHIKMLEWISDTDKEISKLRKERDEKKK